MSSSDAASQALLTQIEHDAHADGIDLASLPFAAEALQSILALGREKIDETQFSFDGAQRIDVHTHPIPAWFRTLEPHAAGRATPSWSVAGHLGFMASHQIAHAVLSVSTPQANVFLGERDDGVRRRKTVALARLLNAFAAELATVYPRRFSWLAVLPLPYVREARVELDWVFGRCASEPLGVGVLTNHEGVYPGDPALDALWEVLDKRAEEKGRREVVFVHPTEPVMRIDGGLFVNSRPSPLRSGLGEFYFETARAISSITASSTFLRYPRLHWRVSHGAGAFPDISERFLLGFPNVSEQAREAYKTRFWYDSAGPVWPRQIKGLTEGMGVPISQMVFGTDYPYGIGFWDVDANINGLADVQWISEADKEAVFWGNAKRLWEGSKALDGLHIASDDLMNE